MGEPIRIAEIKLREHELSPCLIRMSNYIEGRRFAKGDYVENRHVVDLEIEYFTYSEGGMYINDTWYDIKKGQVAVKRPGDFTLAIMPYTCYVIGVDISGTCERISYKSQYLGDIDVIPYYHHQLVDNLPPVITPKNSGTFKVLFEQLMEEYINPSELTHAIRKKLVLDILIQLNMDSGTYRRSLHSAHKKNLEKAIAYMNDRFYEVITLNDLARVAGLSHAYFHKMFKKEIGVTPLEYLTGIRINHAKRLLVMSVESMTYISVECGFDSATYFSTVFKKYVGMTPGQYRRITTQM